MAAPHISACVITLNEADRLPLCLDSVAWCDELVVVDSGSADGTPAIAERHGARVIVRDWPGYAAQKQFAVEQARNDWVLCIDADERVSPELAIEIQSLADSPEMARAYEMPRRTWYLGDWVRHGTWYPDWSLRLFDRRVGAWRAHPDHDVHERVVVRGPVARLRGDLLHYPYRDRAEHLATIERYTSLIAEGLHQRGKRATAWHRVGHPAWEFFRALILKRGLLDGRRGIELARLHAHYVHQKYSKLAALQARR